MWQDIASAPKDGKGIILLEPFEGLVISGYWAKEDSEWRPARGMQFWQPPTHWMPYPALTNGERRE